MWISNTTTADHKPLPRRPRDHRIDLLRGFALVSIFINHMPGNRLEHLTSRNFGFSDAAELFVLLAGVSAAFAFFPRFAAGDRAGSALRSLRRAATLYGAHIGSTLAAVLVFGLAAWFFENDAIYDLIGLGPFLDDPVSGAVGFVFGQYQLGYFNILPLYIFLILLLPGLMWLAERDLWLMLAVSIAVYLLAQFVPVRLPNFPADGSWYFNPFAWQLLYSIGLALGIAYLKDWRVPWHPALGLAAAVYTAYSCIWMVVGLGGNVTYGLLPEWMDTLAKPVLPLSRLLHVLALGYLLTNSPAWTWLAQVSPNMILTRLGRHSLPVFVAGSLLSMVGYIVIVTYGSSWLLDTGLATAGVAIMTAIVTMIEARYLPRAAGAALVSARRGFRSAQAWSIAHGVRWRA